MILGCLHLAGGPYSIIQGYAWVSMLASYSQDDGILKAAKDTFSGEKPCSVCEWIASAREADTGDNPQPFAPPNGTATAKLLQEMLPASVASAPPPRGHRLSPPAFAAPPFLLPQDLAAPPLPPPRAAV